MLNQTISDYLQAIRQRAEARTRFAELAEIISSVGQRMTEFQKSVTPSNPRVHQMSFGGHGLAYGILNPQTWPSADAVIKARQTLTAAESQVEQLWNEIDVDMRVGLKSPDAT